jgi:hypothetical protein
MDLMSDECYRSINHSERMMKKMESYLCHRKLCDVILVTGAKRIAAHRVVLSAASDYFAAMFTNDVKEATQEEIKMKDIDSEALALLVQYMYTGKHCHWITFLVAQTQIQRWRLLICKKSLKLTMRFWNLVDFNVKRPGRPLFPQILELRQLHTRPLNHEMFVLMGFKKFTNRMCKKIFLSIE